MPEITNEIAKILDISLLFPLYNNRNRNLFYSEIINRYVTLTLFILFL
jgi:hypothetical protein